MTEELTPRQRELVEMGVAVLRQHHPDAPLGSQALPDDDAVAVWTQIRGGGTLIVADDESMLFCGSAMDFDRALAEFRSGRRSDIASA